MEVINVKIELNSVIKELDKLNSILSDHFQNDIFQNNDTRKIVFIGLRNELQYKLLSIMLSKNLLDIDFYKNQGIKTENIDDVFLQKALDNHLRSITISFFILFVTHFENYIRLVANYFGLEKFTISKTFNELKTRIQLDHEDENLFKIVFNIRNSFHNGGFFSHENTALIFKDREYLFVKNQIVTFPNHISFVENNLFLAESLIQLVIKINKLTNDIDFIEHNYSKITLSHE
jgi:hypothetical protein